MKILNGTRAVTVGFTCGLLTLTASGQAQAAPSEPTPIGMNGVTAVSKNGKIALGRDSRNRAVVRKISTGKTKRILKSKVVWPGYQDISDNGRFVLVQRRRADVGILKVSSGRYRSAVTKKSGARLKASWKGRKCGENCYDSDRPTVRGGLSGNGRYVVFCANLKVPTRGDLYIKNMRTRRLKLLKGVCPTATDPVSGRVNLPWPGDVRVSEDGRVILLGQAETVRLVVNKGVRDLPIRPYLAEMAEDGSAIYYGVVNPTPTGPSEFSGRRYDIATGAVTDLAAGDPAIGDQNQGDYRVQDSLTRRGRFVSYSGSIGGQYSTNGAAQIGVFDRQTSATTDLTWAIDALGLPRNDPPSPDGFSRTTEYDTLISGDGKTFLFGHGPWYRIALTY